MQNDVVTSVLLKIQIMWDAALCRSTSNPRRFEVS
jgi:hypothetical protein